MQPWSKWTMGFLAGGICLFWAPTVSFGEDGPGWPQWRGPDRTGISLEKEWTAEFPKAGPKTLWKVSLGVGCCSVAVKGDRLYTLGNEADVDTVYCLEVETGKTVWKHSYDCPTAAKNFEGGPCATPAIDGDRVYTFSRDGHLFCLNAGDGKVVWSKNAVEDWGAERPTWGFSSSPLVKGDSLFLIADNVFCLDKATGDVEWKTEKLRGGYSSPMSFALEGEEFLAAFCGVGLTVLKAADGSELFRHPWETSYDANVSTPIVSGNEIFISSGYNKGCALLRMEKGKASVVYESKEMRNAFNSSILWNGHLYGFDEVDLKCLEMTAGEAKWKQRKLGRGSLTVADGKAIVMSERGQIVVAEASPDGFEEISRAQVLGGKCWVVPVLCDGRLYCRNNEGDLVCLDLRKS